MAQSKQRRPSLDEVLRLVQQLPAGEQEQLRCQLNLKLHNFQRPDAVPHAFFDWKIDLDALAEQQGAPTSVTLESLRGDFWPEDEDLDEFVATIREWRHDTGRR